MSMACNDLPPKSLFDRIRDVAELRVPPYRARSAAFMGDTRTERENVTKNAERVKAVAHLMAEIAQTYIDAEDTYGRA